MKKVIRSLTLLPGVLFIGISLRWLIDPEAAAASIGMPLLDGIARSSQIGDLGAFFLAAGSMLLLGVITLQRAWFYGAALLLGGGHIPSARVGGPRCSARGAADRGGGDRNGNGAGDRRQQREA